MNLEYLHKCFDENPEINVLEFKGKCEICEKDFSIIVRLTEQGFDISGGALIDEHTMRCDDCITTEVYSRCVGYLRPEKNWNKGKREEFKNRKMFDLATL